MQEKGKERKMELKIFTYTSSVYIEFVSLQPHKPRKYNGLKNRKEEGKARTCVKLVMFDFYILVHTKKFRLNQPVDHLHEYGRDNTHPYITSPETNPLS